MTKNPDPDPDPLVRGMDPRIQIRIHNTMSRIRNTGIRTIYSRGEGYPQPSLVTTLYRECPNVERKSPENTAVHVKLSLPPGSG
jgi:hypothetical protein